ncbi:MAG: helix-hairpin-helix domain-containing protein [Armatimonadetes bacterium]|nr:helix-hairpin-helix domain-containing protein [Armatimonadota bacterium]
MRIGIWDVLAGVLLGTAIGAGTVICASMIGKSASPARGGRALRARKRIDINNASKEELMQIEGIGPTVADEIIRYREDHGGFESVDDLDNVRGFGEAMLKRIRNKVFV